MYFGKRISKEGVTRILEISSNLHGKQAKVREVCLADTTVQEKNIAFPTDTKLYSRVIEHCIDIAGKSRLR